MTSDKSYATEQRLNALINSLAPMTGPATDQTINAGWANTIGTLTVPVIAGFTYHFRAKIVGQQVAPGAVSQLVGLTGPTANWIRITYTDIATGAPPAYNHENFSQSLGPFGTAVYPTSQVWVSEFTGNVSFLNGGTLALAGGNTGGVNWLALAHYCYLIAVPANG